MSERVRIAFVGDTHNDDNNPISRKDNYLDTCIEELHETLEIAREYKCKAYIHAGDVFHRINPGIICVNKTLNTFLHDNNGIAWGFDIYATLGNHDVKHNPQEYYHKSAFYTLVKSKAIKFVDAIPELRIGFGHFRSTIEDDLLAGCLKDKDYLLWSLHANVTLGGFFENASYADFHEIPTHPDCKLLMAGHIHYPLEGRRKDGLKYINPGSICRNALLEYNLNRMPRVLIVEYALDGSFLETQYVPLTKSRPASELFNLEENKLKKAAKADISAYIKQINQMKSSRVHKVGQNKYQWLKEFGKNKEINDTIIDMAISRVRNINEKRGVHEE